MPLNRHTASPVHERLSPFHVRALALAALLLWAANPTVLHALSITGYSSAVNDRFSSGYNADPVTSATPNNNPGFIGLGYNWSGVGWSDSDLTKSYGMISPQHYLVATHYGGTSKIKFFGGNSLLYGAPAVADRATGYGPSTPGDVTLGTLAVPLPSSAQVTYYPILDLVPSITSQSYAGYQGKNIFIYGRSGRIGSNTTNQVTYYQNGYYVNSSAASCAYESGDSGSPIFVPWTDPTGVTRLTILGAAWAVDNINAPTINYDSFLPDSNVAARLNILMANEGYALRWVGNASRTWTGSASNLFSDPANWLLHSVPFDTYAAFDGSATTQQSVSLAADQTLRGLIFKNATAGGNGFTFSTGSTLTIGRGGIVNYDANDAQTFQCAVTLSDAQWWDCGAGGLNVTGAINNAGYLLLIDGAGNTTLGSNIAGAGGLAKEGTGTLTVSGTASFGGALSVHNGILNLTNSSGNTYGGGTVVSGGTLLANNNTGSATGPGAVTVASGASLGGSGIIAPSGANNITINGSLSPGVGGTASTLHLSFSGGSLVLAGTGIYVLKAGTVSDLTQLNNAQVTLGGTLQISQTAGFSYLGTYKLFSGLSGAPSGNFSSVSGIAPGWKANYTYNGGDYFVSFIPTTYSTWQTFHFTSAEISGGQANDTADYNKSGTPNLVKYALGIDPKASPVTAVGLPVMDATGTYMTLTVSKNPDATDLAYSVEVSGDLTNASSWSSANTTVLTNTSTALVVRDNTPIAGSGHRFIRLRVSH